MSPEEAQALIAKDPRNAGVLQPYLGGEDLNQSPTHTASRWIINFHDWSEDKAKTYPDCYAIVEEKVKPERTKLLAKSYGTAQRRGAYWWLYASDAKNLYRAVTGFDRVLAIARHTAVVLPVFVPTGQLFSDATTIFAFEDDFHFGLLTSGIHWRWALRHGSTLGVGVRYTPSDVFETFALPSWSENVAAAAEALDAHRKDRMVTMNEGLTTTYNHFHDSNDSTPAIVTLRELHVVLDHAVRDAYGWDDLDLQHGFHPVRGQGTRFTFAPAVAEEILERLLELNKERYEAEVVEGLHGPLANSTSKNAPRRKSGQALPGVLSLFGEDEEPSGMGDQE